jgi:thymidylate synthase (FAD)
MSSWMLKQYIKDALDCMHKDFHCTAPKPIAPEPAEQDEPQNDSIFFEKVLVPEPEIVVESSGQASDNFIYVFGDNIGGVEYIDGLGDDRRVAEAARASFGKAVYETELRDKDKRLIRRLMADGHTSPFEQVEFVVKIVAPIFVARHFLRHRTFSVNEISRRFTSENIQFYYHDTFYTQAEKNLQCSTDVEVADSLSHVSEAKEMTLKSFEFYNKLIQNGVSREDARVYLPQNLYTSWWMKGNGHNWVSMLHKRLHPGAQRQTRAIAEAIKTLFIRRFPFIGELAFKDEQATNDKK